MVPAAVAALTMTTRPTTNPEGTLYLIFKDDTLVYLKCPLKKKKKHLWSVKTAKYDSFIKERKTVCVQWIIKFFKKKRIKSMKMMSH